MTTKELWSSKTPAERKMSLKYILINVTLIKANPCGKNFLEINYLYSYLGINYIVFKKQYDKERNLYYIYSKSI